MITRHDVENAKNLVRERLGARYVFGGMFDRYNLQQGTDCSGVWQDVLATALGRLIWGREAEGNTTEAYRHVRVGEVGPFGTIRVARPQDIPADAVAKLAFHHEGNGGASSHMWGELDGMRIESAGSKGLVTGDKAWPIDHPYANAWAYLPGPIDESDDSHAIDVLLDALAPTGVNRDRIGALFPAVSQCLDECGCNTVDRRAMWFAQIGHESGGLRYMEEIADGSQYEGRPELGNTQPGDGRKFKGRGPIQVTGRRNYTVLSQWAHDQGLVPTPTFFVDDPAQLSSDTYGFIGVTWYWTTQRPMNDYADRRDIEGGSIAVNGRMPDGRANGIEERITRYNHALYMGDQLLEITTTGDDSMSALTADEQRRLLARTDQVWGALFNPIGSLSKYKTAGEGDIYTTKDLIRFIDKNLHEVLIEAAARDGNPEALALVKREADKGDRWAKVVYDHATTTSKPPVVVNNNAAVCAISGGACGLVAQAPK